MFRKITVVVLMMMLVMTAAACGVLQEPEAASGEIEAIPLAVATAIPATAVPAAVEEVVAETVVEAAPTVEQAATAEEPAATEEAAPAAAAEPTVYTIDQTASQVRFELDEDLRGSRITVVGITDQVAGQLALNLADLSTAQIGVLQINARTLMTDNNFRNRAIQNEILDTGEYEFITFAPTSVDGLPASATVGQPVQFTITGDLTIRDITQPVTFTVEATAASEGQIVGTASAVINRADYELNIPSVPSVANVEEEVDLIINFTANAG